MHVGHLTTAVATGAVLAFSAPALAQPGQSSTASGTARATVVKPLVVVSIDDLSFGAVAVAAGSSGQIVVGVRTGDISYGGSARGVCAATTTCSTHPARFSVRGEAHRDYQVQIPATVLASGARGASPQLPVGALVVESDSLPGQGNRGRLDQAGADEFRIGGTLTVPSGTAPDRYRAQVPVVVTYI